MTQYADIEALKARLAQACRVLGRLDLTKAATGHASARLPGTDRIFIRARGPEETGVRYTEAEQIIEVDWDGRAVGASAGLKPPLEVFIHTEMYRRRADIGAVVHMHPASVVACTVTDTQLLPIYGAYDPRGAQMAIDVIPTYPRAILIDSPALGAEFAAAQGRSSACLMRGHGATTVAAQIEDAALNMILINELAQMNLLARQLGAQKPISTEDQAAISSLERNASGAEANELSPRSAVLWRYYCALTGA